MLRKTYNRDYIDYSEFFGYQDGQQDGSPIQNDNLNITLGSKLLEYNRHNVVSWHHLSVLNKSSMAVCGTVLLYLNHDQFIINKDPADSEFNIDISLSNIYNNSNHNTISGIGYDGYKILNRKYHMYGTCVVYLTLWNNTKNIESIDIPYLGYFIVYPEVKGVYYLRVSTHDIGSGYIKYELANSSDEYSLDKIHIQYNITFHGSNDYFSMKYADSLKKKFKVFILNNIKHLQNYYIN